MSSNSNFQDKEEIVEIKDASEGEFKVLLELEGAALQKDRPGLDLVIVVDASASMGGQKMEKMKTALQFVIRELNLTDRLSVITSCGEGERLFPLRQINKSSQEEIEDVVNSLVARGGTDVTAGLKMGLKMINDRCLTHGRVAGLILISDGYTDGDASLPPFGDLPVYTFGFGSNIDSKTLKAIADTSNGGTYTEVENLDDLSVAISQPLARLVTVVAQDVKLTITPLELTSKVALDGSYPQCTDDVTGSVTVSFGDLSDKEFGKVTLNLVLLPPPLPISQPEKKLLVWSTLTDMYVWLLMCGSCLMAVLKWLVRLLVRTRKSQEAERVEAIIKEKSIAFVNVIKNAKLSANENMLYFAREKQDEVTKEANTSNNSTNRLKPLNQSIDSLNNKLKKAN